MHVGRRQIAGAVPPLAMALTLLAAEPVIWIAARRRVGMGRKTESNAEEETSPTA